MAGLVDDVLGRSLISYAFASLMLVDQAVHHQWRVLDHRVVGSKCRIHLLLLLHQIVIKLGSTKVFGCLSAHKLVLVGWLLAVLQIALSSVLVGIFIGLKKDLVVNTHVLSFFVLTIFICR